MIVVASHVCICAAYPTQISGTIAAAVEAIMMGMLLGATEGWETAMQFGRD